MNLLQRINEVRKAVGYVQKDKTVSTGQGSVGYRAVTHDFVTAMVRPHMIAQGIICFPYLVESSCFVPPIGPDGKQRQLRYDATYDFTFVSAEDPADRFIIRIQAHANDGGDKAPGKALSYAKKYAILKLFEIETGEDDESRVPSREGMPQEQYDEFVRQIEAQTTKAKAKEIYSAAVKVCEGLKDLDSHKGLKTTLLAHAAFIDQADKS